MQKCRTFRDLRRELTRARHAKSQDFNCTVPAAHDLRGLQAIVKYLMGMCVIEAAANLPSNVEQVPNRKPFLTGQHGANTVALHILHGGAELAFDFSRAKNRHNVGAADGLGALGLGEQCGFQIGGTFAEGAQTDGLQRNGLTALRIVGFVNRACSRFGQFTQDFKVADFRGHCLVVPLPANLPAAARSRALERRFEATLGYPADALPSSYRSTRSIKEFT